MVRNIQFEAGLPGPRELRLTWRGITGHQIIQLLAGPAVDLILPDLDLTEVYSHILTLEGYY